MSWQQERLRRKKRSIQRFRLAKLCKRISDYHEKMLAWEMGV